MAPCGHPFLWLELLSQACPDYNFPVPYFLIVFHATFTLQSTILVCNGHPLPYCISAFLEIVDSHQSPKPSFILESSLAVPSHVRPSNQSTGRLTFHHCSIDSPPVLTNTASLEIEFEKGHLPARLTKPSQAWLLTLTLYYSSD
jgi:hypothetical protein